MQIPNSLPSIPKGIINKKLINPITDLRTGAFSGGGGEAALLGAASGQMSAFYGVPGGMGAGMSDSKLPDNQAGYEKALTLSLAALSGSGFVYESAGMLASLLG